MNKFANYVILIAFALTLVLPTSSVAEETYIIDKTISDNWHIYCALCQPDGFGTEIYQYAYTQKKASDEVDAVNQQLKSTFVQAPTLTTDPLCRSFMYSNTGVYMLDFPSPILNQTSCAQVSQALTEKLLGILEHSSFQPYHIPYIQSSFLELYQYRNLGGPGKLYSWDEHIRSCLNSSAGLQPEAEDLLLVFVPEINGYPIVPVLLGNFLDTDVPMYSLMLLREDQPYYMEIGCSHEISKQRLIEEPTIPWTTAVDMAVDAACQQWKPAWDAMAQMRDESFDYPAFWRAYNPQFTLRVHSVQTSYYARNQVLRPCWQVELALEINLSNDENLTSAERHSYLPEMISMTYIIDAVTGEKVV